MPIFKKISKVFLILGVISLIYGGRIFTEGRVDFQSFVPIRGEFIFAMALIFSLFYFLYLKNLSNVKFTKGFFFALYVFLSSILMASVISLFRYELWFDSYGWVMVIKLLLNIGIFILMYVFLKHDPIFYRKICLALYIPPLLLIPFAFSPGTVREYALIFKNIPMMTSNQGMPMMFTSWDRFSGFTLNPIHMGYLNIIALSFLSVIFFHKYHKKEWFASLLYLSLIAGLVILNFWSLSRSIMIATFLVLTAANIIVNSCFKKNITKGLIYYNGLIIIFFTFIFLFLLPSATTLETSTKENILARLTYSQLYETRTPIWIYYIKLIPENILGLGMNYEQQFYLEDVQLGRINTHSFLLENWAIGGIGALFGIGYLLWKAFKNIRERISDRYNPLIIYHQGTFISLFGIFICSLFTGGIFLIQFWILLAMALSCPNSKR